MPPVGASKFHPLAAYLHAQQADTLTLSFREIEALIGSPLPDSAYVSVSYWRGKAAKAARAWLAVGWEAVQIDRRGQAVLFRRLTKG